MMPAFDPVGTAGPAVRATLKHVACFAVAAALISMPGCVTVGYDFVRQQATLTYTHTPKTDGYKK